MTSSKTIQRETVLIIKKKVIVKFNQVAKPINQYNISIKIPQNTNPTDTFTSSSSVIF